MKKKIITIMFLIGSVLIAKDGNKVAVIVGIDSYDSLTSLSAGVNDSEGMFLHYKSMDFNHVFVVNDRQVKRKDQPSIPNIKRVMKNVLEISESSSIEELVFFFAGHGVQIAGSNYLCFPESDIQDKSGMLSVENELLPWLRKASADLTMVFLDACRESLGTSRSVGAERGIQIVERKLEKKKNDSLGIMVVYATKPGGFSYEKEDGTNGFFTETLLEALSQKEDQTVGGMVSYLTENLPKKTLTAYGKVQTPYIGGDFDLMAMLTSTTSSQSQLRYQGSGELFINTNIDDADIFMNGIKVGKSPQFIDGINSKKVIIEARKDEYYSKQEVVFTTDRFKEINMTLKESFGRIYLRTNKNVKIFLNGSDEELTIREGLISDIPVGVHNVVLKSKGLYWQGDVNVLLDDTIQLTPQFKEVGSINYSLPDGVNAELKNLNTSDKYVINGKGIIDNITIGKYKVRVNHKNYKNHFSNFTLDKSGTIDFIPQLEYTEEYSRELTINSLNEEITMLQEAYDIEYQTRKKLNRGGLISFCSALVFSGLTTYLYFENENIYSDYSSTNNAKKAVDLREQYDFNKNLFLGSAIGAALSATGGITLFTIGPKPKKTEMRIKKNLNDIQLLKGADL